MDLRDVVHSEVVCEDGGDGREAGAVACVDDQEGEADPEREDGGHEHRGDGDGQEDEQDVDAMSQPVAPPGEDEASGAVHQSAAGEDEGDGGLLESDGLHELLGEWDERESTADVEEHEEPCAEEPAVRQQASVGEAAPGGGGDFGSDAVGPQRLARLVEHEGAGHHRQRVDGGQGAEDAGRGAAAAQQLLQQSAQRRAPPEADDRHRRRDRLVVEEPQHQRLHRRDVDDAGAQADHKAIAQIDGPQGVELHAQGGHQQAGQEQAKSNKCGQADILLDNFAEECGSHSEEEDAEGEGELHA